MKIKINSRKQLEEFIQLVWELREAQQLYFKTRSKSVLSLSISLEKKLDAMLSSIMVADSDIWLAKPWIY